MRKFLERHAAMSVLIAGAILAVLLLTSPSARRAYARQQPPLPASAAPGSAAKKAPSLEVMTFPSDRDSKNMIQAVKDYLKEYKDNDVKAPWDRICKAAQEVLNAKSDSFFEMPKAASDAPIARVSAKAEINRLIGEFPKGGREFYQQNYGADAEKLLAAARVNYYDRAQLADISQRFFHTKAGAEATLLLADVQLERGNYAEAAYSYERLLERPDGETWWTPTATFKAIAALKRAGTAANSPSLKKLHEMLEKKFPREGVVVGRRNYSLEELRAELDQPLDAFLSRINEAFIAMRYGDVSHTALADGGKPYLDAAWSLSMFHNIRSTSGGNVWVKQQLEAILKTTPSISTPPSLPGFFPATSKNVMYIRTYDGVHAVVTKDGTIDGDKPRPAGHVLWQAFMYGAAASLYDRGEHNGNITGYSQKEVVDNLEKYTKTFPAYRSILYENPLNGSISHDGARLYVVDESALPPPPPDPNGDFNGMMAINPAAGAVPTTGKLGMQNCNYLVALDIVKGTRAWVLGIATQDKPLTQEEEEKSTNTLHILQNSFFLGPPLPVNGKLYVLYERNGTINLACLDPNRILTHPVEKYTHSYPALVWNQKLGEPYSRLPQETSRRFQCSYLAYADGVLVCPTNTGAVVAVDVMSRSFLWARSYRTLKAGNTELGNGRRVSVGSMASPLDANRWRAAAPIISQGRVAFAAFDSNDLLCLDLRSGEIIWREPRKAGDLYIGGLMGENILIVAKDTIRAVKLTGKPKTTPDAEGREDVVYAWKDIRIGTPAGHGTASKDGLYYLPVTSSSEEPLPQVWAIDAAKGEVVAKAAYRKKDLTETKPMLGNLVFHEGQLFSQSPLEIAAFPLIELKKQEMNRLLAANPNDPAGLLARGEMWLDGGKLNDAILDFQSAAKNSPPAGVQMRLRDKLFMAYTELLRRDFTAAEEHLEDYKKLCTVPITADDPNQKLRQKDEHDRRQRLYMELMARGREAQGKLPEAFDFYRSFASYGGNKELVSLSDEPNGQTRPDLWARGRIEAMIRKAKDDKARQSLEDLVMREWRQVKDGKNAGKLREFVNIFGQHFAVGREAELLLGQTLIASDKAEDQSEAQRVLTRLASTADEELLAAKALESLAKMATAKGQGETAIGHYMTIGTRYPNIALREGVTGADLLNGLLTDKRLLPYLEPARLPTPAKVKAVKENANNNHQQQGYILEPDGCENEPFYRRHRIALTNDQNAGGWTLRLFDRASGEEKWKQGGLQLYNPNGTVNFRIAQARGSMLLLHLGIYVYCFDLAEKRKCWEYPVFGEGVQLKLENARFNAGGDDEMVIENFTADGAKFTVGRASVLESHYAALITRDGLVALDPGKGHKLWTRTNIAPSSLIFGDARHVFIVETVAGKSTSKVLRAVDGTPVEGVPDFASLVTGSGRIRILGRNLLLTESAVNKPLVLRLYDPLVGKDVWRKEYAPMAEPADYNSTGLEFKGQAKLLKTYTADITGVFERSGKFEVLDTQTGKAVFAARIDEANAELHAGMTGLPVLLADAERFYLVLNRDSEAINRQTAMNAQMRVLTVSGPMYCYEKATAKRTWYLDKLLEKQSLYIDRFSEMPALVSAANATEDAENGGAAFNRGGGRTSVYRVAVIDKVNGRLRFYQNLNTNNGYFFSCVTDPRQATVVLKRTDLNLTISPDDGTQNIAPATPTAAMPSAVPQVLIR